MEIRVSEESVNPCGDEQKTVWMELAFDVPLQELSIGEQLETIDKVSDSLLRIYTNQYKDEIRRSEVFESGLVDEPTSDDTFLLWKVSCNDLDDDGLEALENVLTLISDEAIELEHKPVGWKTFS
ncbi:unnamed protein product [Anisakis simplex]|uniref:Uncharacterized protein n=1 Tax=Anisakis simplex TaxID=6269 RepID=A0A3P6PQB3_ANISI|nr:unnamed protein product [Anisakis simplex]